MGRQRQQRQRKEQREEQGRDAAGDKTKAITNKNQNPIPMPSDLSEESIYDFYKHNIFPAIAASFPLLFQRLTQDGKELLSAAGRQAMDFLLPKHDWKGPNYYLSHMMEQASTNSTAAEFMLRHFDTNNDGHISASELLNMTELLSGVPTPAQYPQNWFQWFSRAWPLMDWKLGVFLWQSSSGLLIVIALASMLPSRIHGLLARVLRWPVLGLTYFLITVELVVYIIIRIFIRIVETVFANSKHRALRRKMRLAKSYDEWYGHAKDLDISQGRHNWQEAKDDASSSRFNWSFVRALMHDLKRSRQKGDTMLALAILQQCTRKNVGGIMSEESFSFTNTGEPKHIVKQFINEAVTTLRWVTDECVKERERNENDNDKLLSQKTMQEHRNLYQSLLSWATLNFPKENTEQIGALVGNGKESEDLSRGPETYLSQGPQSSRMGVGPQCNKAQVISFLKRARAAYGRTALCLSGGAMMGNYHFGHVKALLEQDTLPRILSGTSAGAVVAAIVCTRTDEELHRDLDPAVLAQKLTCFSLPWSSRIRNLWKKGCMFNLEDWRELIEWMTCGDMTFEEAYKKTGRVLCVTLSSTTKNAPPVLINHISAPNVVIASAIVASAAVPGFIEPARLEVKGADGKVTFQGDKDELYWDGSIDQDIPTSGLAEMLNCQFFVAAQCNPHIVPFFFNCRGGVGRPTRWSSGDREEAWRGGFLLSALELYLKNDMKSKFQFLSDIEAAVSFTANLMTQQFVGSTTIVPQVSFWDYFRLFTNPTYNDLIRYEQAGTIAAYEHCDMIKSHYHIANALEECLKKLENDGKPKPSIHTPPPASSLDRMGVRSEVDAAFRSESFSLETNTTDDDSSHGFDEIDLFVRSS